MRRFGWFIAVLCFALPGFTGCENPADPGGQPEPEPGGIRAGLYAFSGDYVPGETETTAEPVAVLPFSLENALAEINAAETPQSYLILLDKEDSRLSAASLPEGLVLVLKGLGEERIVQFYNIGTGGSLFSLSGGQTLILDENIALLGNEANKNPLIIVGNDSRLEIHSGASIQGHGGIAVRAVSGGVFAMEGGAIESCGGGVELNNGGVFTMKSGSIAGNAGGGVMIDNSGGVFAMESGTITGNAGGGVSVESGSFTMQDGVISNNNRAAAGGGVFIRHGNFVMEGGSISRNTSAGNGGGVMTFGSFAMNGGTITENHAASGGGGVHGNFSIAGGSIFDNTSGDPNPLYKNINSVPVAQGDAFTIEGYREATDISFTVRDINGYVKDRVNGGRTYTCSAEVLGVGGPPQEVTWSISGNKSASTSIDPETGALAVGYDETAETLVLTATSVSQSEMSRDLSLPVDLFVEWNLKNKFDIAESGIAGVSAVFNALHEYIAAGHLSDANEKNIGVGDFVNLYSLAVADTVTPGYSRGSFNIMNAVLPYDRGSTLRLIVVGVNSYKGLNGNGDSPAGDHLVFQFQNIPVSRRMEATNTNAAGYTGSEMRKYLSPVEGFEDSGCFYQGLVEAGVPASVFYSPRRALSNGTGIEIIEDLVWLPTAAEMNAFAINEAAGKPAPPVGEAEAQAAQPVFAYYNADTINKYPTSGSRVYWTGSPDTQGGFITYINYFSPDSTPASALGVVPAFCVH